MIKKYVKGILVFSIVALLAGCSGGEEGAKTSEGGAETVNAITAGKTGEFVLEGTISQINTITNTFVLNTKEGDVPIQVRVMSRLMIEGERKPLSSVRSGSHAKGTFKKWSGKDVVKEIVITPGE